MANAIDVQKYLSGVDYPADRRALVDHARGSGAPDDVVELLEGIEDREYDGPERRERPARRQEPRQLTTAGRPRRGRRAGRAPPRPGRPGPGRGRAGGAGAAPQPGSQPESSATWSTRSPSSISARRSLSRPSSASARSARPYRRVGGGGLHDRRRRRGRARRAPSQRSESSRSAAPSRPLDVGEQHVGVHEPLHHGHGGLDRDVPAGADAGLDRVGQARRVRPPVHDVAEPGALRGDREGGVAHQVGGVQRRAARRARPSGAARRRRPAPSRPATPGAGRPGRAGRARARRRRRPPRRRARRRAGHGRRRRRRAAADLSCSREAPGQPGRSGRRYFFSSASGLCTASPPLLSDFTRYCGSSLRGLDLPAGLLGLGGDLLLDLPLRLGAVRAPLDLVALAQVVCHGRPGTPGRPGGNRGRRRPCPLAAHGRGHPGPPAA